MSFSSRIAVFFILILLISASSSFAENPDLIGNWIAKEGNQTQMLIIKEGNVLDYNGQEYMYFVMQNMIIVGDIYDQTFYPFELQGDRLMVDMSADGIGLRTYERVTDEQFQALQEKKQALDRELGGRLTGVWNRVKGGRQITLNPDGTFADWWEGAASGTFSDAWSGEQTGSWGAYNSDETRGTWRAEGTAEQGVLYLTGSDGSQSTLRYQVHTQQGQTYWNEYWIEGSLYNRK